MKDRRFQFALVLHPMLLLVHEDRGMPPLDERIPPWGAPDTKAYVDRLRRNLDALRRYPNLRLNYEFSGVELEILAENAPGILAIMRELIREGRLAIVGGDFAQPHGQLFSGELNYRQIEHGLQVIRDLTGYDVRNNFHQETCLYDQLPQLLKSFGFETASPPTFTHTITPVSAVEPPDLIKNAEGGYVPRAADSVASWQGLDGTEIPLVILGLSRGAALDPKQIRQEAYKGLYRSSPIILAAPDLVEIEPERREFMQRLGDSVLLDRALSDVVRNQAADWQVRLHTYWSYAEGEWAEQVYRQIRRTEAMLLAEETQATLRAAAPRKGYISDLRTVLAAMHHDVHWLEVTDLKEKYLRRLAEVEKRARTEITRLVGGTVCDGPIPAGRVKVTNALPYGREEIVRLRTAGPARVEEANGAAVPSLCLPSWDDPAQTELLFAARVPSCGETHYRILAVDDPAAAGKPCAEAAVLAGTHEYIIGADGTVRAAKVDGRNILAGPGHDLHYLTPGGEPVGGPGRPGRMLLFQSDLGDILRISAPIGEIRAEIEYLASPWHPFLAISTRFTFNGDEIGTMWEDWTKLNAYWPVAGRAIRYGVPFGTVSGREGVPLYAPHWLSVQGPAGGLAVFNTGTPKHFVEESVIGCVLAWGGRTFTNRTNTNWEERQMHDLTLRGTHAIRSGVMAFPSGTSEVALTRAAQCLNSPLLVDHLPATGGGSPRAWTVDLDGTGLVGTALLSGNGPPVCRFFEPAGQLHQVGAIRAALGAEVQVTDLAGRMLERVEPYRIGYLTLLRMQVGHMPKKNLPTPPA